MPVLYIDIDSLRPDHMGTYGYEGNTTPNLDQFAEDAIRFDRMYAANSPCMPSRAGFLTGRYGINNGVTTHGEQGQRLHDAEEDDPTLPELLFEQGIQTAAVASFPRHPAPWFYHLWHEYHHPQESDHPAKRFQAISGEVITERATDVLDRIAGDEFFLYVQYWDPHGPYRRSDDEIDEFRDVPLPPYPTEEQIRDHREWNTWRSAGELGIEAEALQHIDADSIENRKALNELISHYDAEIKFADQWVGALLDTLRDMGLYDDTLVVITADHGEEFGEHGVYREHWSVYDGTQRIPLLVKPPASTTYKPGKRNQLVTNVDMAPTIADYAGLESAPAWQGRSLRPILEDTATDWRDHIIVDHGLYTAQRAVRTNRWKFVRTYHPGHWGEVTPDRQLFDMQADPYEQEDVAPDHPDVVEELETKMAVWAEEHVGPSEDSLHKTARLGPVGASFERN